MKPLQVAMLGILFIAGLPGCGRGAEVGSQSEPASNSASAEAAPAPVANVAAVPAQATGCFRPQQVALDAASFARTDGPAFEPGRLETFRQSAESAFRVAAEAACAADEIPSARLAAIRRLLIQSATGATETAIYEDQESVGAGTLVFQWVFVEADLEIPETADIRAGLSCWADPERQECAEREP